MKFRRRLLVLPLLVIVLVANVANVIGEIVAVYGFDLGVAGSAWSTVIVQAAAARLIARRDKVFGGCRG